MTDDGNRTSSGPFITPPAQDLTTYEPREKYTDVRAVAAEGARVGFVTCMECGASLCVDPADEGLNVFKQHDDWHASLNAMHGWANTPEGQMQVTVRRQR